MEATIQGGSNRGWLLFEGGYYSRVATIKGWRPLNGGYYSRVALIEEIRYKATAQQAQQFGLESPQVKLHIDCDCNMQQ